MSLDFYLEKVHNYHVGNITHNLTKMAHEAGIYQALWRPEEIKENITAADLIPLLEAGLAELEADPNYFRNFDSPNGWGQYNHLVQFTKNVLEACREYPEARPCANR